MPLGDHDLRRLREGRHSDPFAVLGCHRDEDGRWWVRTQQRAAVAVAARLGDGREIPLAERGDGIFEAAIADDDSKPDYQLLVRREWQPDEAEVVGDPYRFWLILSEWDLDRVREGRHHHLHRVLGARQQRIDGVRGTRFAVWAPRAERVSVVGDWNGYEGRWHPMRLRHPYGVWELFLPGIGAGAHYKFEILGRDGRLRVKADPMARAAELPPATASIVPAASEHAWSDEAWMQDRGAWTQRPMAIYELHPGSWRRGEGGRHLNWRELAPLLVEHCTRLGFTHVEFLPLAHHPYEGSWGYQVTGHYAPNSRHGSADDLRALVDELHRAGIGVLVDFVPAHFPKDDFALARFDGHPCYEYADPREGEHKDWGTLIFNFRRPEVRNFLIGAALFWFEEFHIDGLRVDAVSAMLYRNYSRDEGEWVPNEVGGNANLEAVSFLQELTATSHEVHPGVIMIAEESTAWQGVTAPTEVDGLGFDFKWNMGWMHDTLDYLEQDPIMRPGVHDRITFHQWYAYDERWILPLSHDEVVHGKYSLLDKLPGDYVDRVAQLRQLLAWQIAVPGRPLLFMGGEFGHGREWSWERELDWHEAEQPERAEIMRTLGAWLAVYRDEPALWRDDDLREGFRWVDVENRHESVIAFLRLGGGARPVLAAFNFTPIARQNYPLCVAEAGSWEVLATTASAAGPQPGSVLEPTGEQRPGWEGVIRLELPAHGALLLAPRRE